jgi:hypothetical protein
MMAPTSERCIVQRLIIIAVMLVCGFASGQSAAQDAIGRVSRLQGEASGTRNGATRALAFNSSVFLNEVVSTAETGSHIHRQHAADARAKAKLTR